MEVKAPHRPLAVALGLGVNSTAMLIGLHSRGMMPNLILFADTGGEKPETYWFLFELDRWLSAHGFPHHVSEWVRPDGFEQFGLPSRQRVDCIVVVRNDGIHGTLENECITNGQLPSKAYGWSKCSEKYKIRPQNKYLKQWPPALAAWAKDEKVCRAIGIDIGEQHRAIESPRPEYVDWYPLIEWGWCREVCLAIIANAGMVAPPKSACYFCPSSTKREVFALHDSNPALFQRAVAIERAGLANATSVKGLGRRWSWEGLVSLPLLEQAGLCDPVADTPCICWDGDGE